MNTCKRCGKKFKGRSRYQEYCNDCHSGKKEVKKMVTKVKKKSITETRIELAQACIDLLKEKEVSEKEFTKIFSRAYSIVKKFKE